MAPSLSRTFLARELPDGAVRVDVDPAVNRHRNRHLAEQVERALADGRDRPPKIGMPWILDCEPEYSQLTRKPRRADGFDVLYEVVDPGRPTSDEPINAADGWG